MYYAYQPPTIHRDCLFTVQVNSVRLAAGLEIHFYASMLWLHMSLKNTSFPALVMNKHPELNCCAYNEQQDDNIIANEQGTTAEAHFTLILSPLHAEV